MAGTLTGQGRNIAEVTTAVANGDPPRKITVDAKGEILELKDTINPWWTSLNGVRVGSDACGPRSRLRRKVPGQADVKGVAGTWKDRLTV